jgi:hypothetical protein
MRSPAKRNFIGSNPILASSAPSPAWSETAPAGAAHLWKGGRVRLNASVLKTDEGSPSLGSNPSPSAYD